MRRTLAISIRAKEAPESVQEENHGLVIALFITQGPERETGAPSGRRQKAPVACCLRDDSYTNFEERKQATLLREEWWLVRCVRCVFTYDRDA